MSTWFARLGEAADASELSQIDSYLRALGIVDALPVVNIHDWNAARDVITDEAWDRRWWEAEQAEKQRLYGEAEKKCGRATLLTRLSQTLAESADAVHNAAAAHAAQRGCADAGLIRAAAGAASESVYLAALAQLAGADDRHPFVLKRSLFMHGRWPLGIVNRRYYLF